MGSILSDMLETRIATAADAALIASHRRAMFAAMGGIEESVIDKVREASEPWTARMIGNGKYMGWITTDDGRPVASAGMLILDWPPHPFDPTGETRAYLLNIFVEPEYRGRGLARALIETAVAEARGRNIRVVSLHASRQGRALYEGFGFHPTNEMMLIGGQSKG